MKAMKMRLAYGQIRSVDKEILTNARQMGIDRVQFNLPYDLKADKCWKYDDLARLKDSCDAYGVTVEAMENMPISFYDKAMLGLEGREEQIENVCESDRNPGTRLSFFSLLCVENRKPRACGKIWGHGSGL